MLDNLQASDLIALGALGISVLSLLATLVATGIARDSVKHAQAIAHDAKAISIERERATLLTALSDDVLKMEETRIAIQGLQVEFEAKPPYVRDLLVEYTGLFGSYLSGVVKAVEDTKKLYDVINDWRPETGEVEFIKAKTEHHRYSRDHEIVAAQANKLIGMLREKMEHASKFGRGIPPG